MRVVVAYVDLHPLTKAAVERYAPHAEYRSTARDTHSYYELLCELWRDREDFILVEQDIEPQFDTFDNLAWCPELWCGQIYSMDGMIAAALGCTKFTKELMAGFPRAMEKAGDINNDGLPAKDWHRCDTRLGLVLGNYGFKIHQHYPQIPHHNTRLTNGGFAVEEEQ